MNSLTSLKHAPTRVHWHFACRYNKISSFDCDPIEIYGDFDCRRNELQSLKGGPVEVGGHYICNDNLLTKIDTVANVEGHIYCYVNKIDIDNTQFDGWCGGTIYCDKVYS